MRSLALLASSLVMLAIAQPASAQSASTEPLAAAREKSGVADEAPPSDDASNAWENAPATRRSGFTAGIVGGLMFGTAHGYPNEFGKIDNPDYRASATGVGGGAILWIGGALTDWFTFGLGGGGGSFGNTNRSSGNAFLFHLETFPLFSLGNRWRDVGVSADFGTGGGTIARKSDATQLSTAGSLSIASFGLFWETWRAGHVVAGPALTLTYAGSDSQVRMYGLAGLRGAFYGGP